MLSNEDNSCKIHYAEKEPLKSILQLKLQQRLKKKKKELQPKKLTVPQDRGCVPPQFHCLMENSSMRLPLKELTLMIAIPATTEEHHLY